MKRSAIRSALLVGAMTAAFVLPAAGATAEPAPEGGQELAGKTVFLDPGHQQSADGHNLQKQVDDGYGGTKDCQTSGMTSLGGTPEYEINYNVAAIVKGALEQLGADVEMSRGATGWGGCITDRAEAANKSGADLAVSIHADSTPTRPDIANHGFHLIIPELPVPDDAANEAQKNGGRAASKIMRDVYKDSGFTPSNYAGKDGLMERDDIAGPALTEVPLAFIEMGNGSNPEDAAMLESAEGQAKNATAIATGIATYLAGGAGGDAVDGAAVGDAGETAPAPATGGEDSADSGATGGLDTGGAGTGGAGTGNGAVDKVLDRLDDVMDLFEQAIEVDGMDSLLALIDDGNVAKLEAIANTALGFTEPAANGFAANF